jgi:hypothetical protein
MSEHSCVGRLTRAFSTSDPSRRPGRRVWWTDAVHEALVADVAVVPQATLVA